MISSRNLGFAILLSVFTFLWGCTGHQRLYGGPVLPPDKVAVIKGSINVFPGTAMLSIMSVDGKRLSPYAEQIEVLPGRHILGVEYHLNLAGGIYANGEVVVEAQEGKIYQLNSQSDGSFVTFSIAEEQAK